MKIRILSLLIGYLFGNILTALIVTKIKGVNVRNIDPTVPKGKGNPGMMNVTLNLGRKYGLIVLVGDSLKIALAMYLTYKLFNSDIAILYSGFGAIIGHNYPFHQKFSSCKMVLE